MKLNKRFMFLALLVFLVKANFALAAGISVEDSLSREYSMKPGDKISGSVSVSNKSNKTQQVNATLVDYTFKADGQTVYGEAGSVIRSNCAWMTVSPKLLTIPANSSASVFFTITAPSDTTLSGSYWSVLMVEPVAEGSLEPPKYEKDKISVGVLTVTRYAIQIVTNMGTTGKRNIKILQKRLITDESGNIILLDIENTGERWLRPNIRVELYDSKGVLAGRFNGERVRIYPTCSVRSQVKLGKVVPGKYTALAIIDNGDQSIWGVKYALDIK